MKLTVCGIEKEYEYGTTFAQIAKDFQKDYKYPVILAKNNGNLRELFKTPNNGDNVEFLDLSTGAGNKTYSRGLIFVLLKAIYNVYGPKKGRSVRIMHKIGCGLYGEIGGFAVLDHVTKPETPFMFVRDYLDVDEFGVDERFRRQGAASEMIRFIRDYAREQGFKKIELNMWEFNEGALAFYEAAGFTTYRRYMEMKL